jgi:hypothetical protein
MVFPQITKRIATIRKRILLLVNNKTENINRAARDQKPFHVKLNYNEYCKGMDYLESILLRWLNTRP